MRTGSARNLLQQLPTPANGAALRAWGVAYTNPSSYLGAALRAWGVANINRGLYLKRRAISLWEDEFVKMSAVDNFTNSPDFPPPNRSGQIGKIYQFQIGNYCRFPAPKP